MATTMATTIEIQGFPHRYELSAPTAFPGVLVFVHGWLLSRAYWQPIVERLSPFYQCLTYDLRGFGESQLAPSSLSAAVVERAAVGAGVAGVGSAGVGNAGVGNAAAEFYGSPAQRDAVGALNLEAVADPSRLQYRPANYARDLGLLLQQLNLQNAWLIGHSLGGSIALWAADQTPQTVAGVICVNSGGGIYLKEEFERFRTVGQLLVKFRPRWLSRFPLLSLPFCHMNVAQPLAAIWGKQRLLDLLAAETEAALGALLDSTTEAEVHQLPQVVARLRQPVHFIAGANDTLMEPKYVHHLASFHPSFEFCGNNVSEIANCGHLAMVEQPEAVTEEIKAILAAYDGF